MTTIQLTKQHEQPTAVLRERVPMAALPEFFGRAFTATMRTLQAQGVHPTGPPFGYYRSKPTGPAGTVEVEAGFPVSGPISAADGVVPSTLPGGRVVEAMHIGSYDRLAETYAEVEQWLAGQGLAAAGPMWECYLSDPETEPPSAWRTALYCPVA